MNQAASFKLLAKCAALSGFVLIVSGSSCATSRKDPAVNYAAEGLGQLFAESAEQRGSCYSGRTDKLDKLVNHIDDPSMTVLAIQLPNQNRDYGSGAGGGAC